MASATQTAKTRLFIISDTHSSSNGRDIAPERSFCPPFPKADVLIHSGDLTMTGTVDENKAALRLLASIPAELKLVIAGNHDLTMDKAYYLEENSRAKYIDLRNYNPENAEIVEQLWLGDAAKEAGVTYLREGMHSFDLSNGAHFTVYSSEWQPEFFNWAFNYSHNEDRWNPPEIISQAPYPKDSSQKIIPATRDPHPIPLGADVDIIMTHGPPFMHGDRCLPGGIRAGCPQLLQALDRVRPKIHCFGHIHEAWGAERVTWRETPHDPTHPEWQSGENPLGEQSEVLATLDSDTLEIQAPDDASVIKAHAATLDVSSSSRKPLQVGKETLLINSSIMTGSGYRPKQAGFLVDIDLPMK
ncbi:Metallo-dependent phosphatase [Microthyrium microscopicum]|uniref:Metallo-dependent phosphatase n=1 Tax=Microthyrium microscopicum TaxID=703497 RepID=A0A6A6UPC8_9PEZI|nr:Metallo-dependent phosphatase [Microthyrium microscopicum]